MAGQDYTPHQQKIIKRYYDNQDTLMAQRLAELVGELYLSQGKKRQKAWASAAAAMQKLGVPQAADRSPGQAGQPRPGRGSGQGDGREEVAAGVP